VRVQRGRLGRALSYAVSSSGAVFEWGREDKGDTPTRVEALSALDVRTVHPAGKGHLLLHDANGHAWVGPGLEVDGSFSRRPHVKLMSTDAVGLGVSYRADKWMVGFGCRAMVTITSAGNAYWWLRGRPEPMMIPNFRIRVPGLRVVEGERRLSVELAPLAGERARPFSALLAAHGKLPRLFIQNVRHSKQLGATMISFLGHRWGELLDGMPMTIHFFLQDATPITDGSISFKLLCQDASAQFDGLRQVLKLMYVVELSESLSS